MSSRDYVYPDLLVSPADLAARLGPAMTRHPESAGDATTPLLLDLRPAEQFARGHLPGAVHLDLFGVSLIDTDPAPMRAFLHIVQSLLASRGVSGERPVVVYDDRSGVRAARAFWFLEVFGHRATRLLDGGHGAWVAAGLPVTREAVAAVPARWMPRPSPDRLGTWHDVKAGLGRFETCILDVRSDAEYRGIDVRAKRGGCIPGAVHLEWTEALDERGAFRCASELQAQFDAVGATPDREVIAYCQGGYRAAHTYLALRLLGYPRVRNYLGSWREWGDREELPIERPSRRTSHPFGEDTR